MTAADERLRDYARLAVRVGLNLQPGQRLAINAFVEHAPLVRAVAREAYEAEARYVDVFYSDQHVRRAHHRVRAGEPARLVAALAGRADRLARQGRRSLLGITGNPEPELFADLDGSRVGRARMKELSAASLKLTDGLCNWSIVAFPSEGWARTVFGEPDVERLWDAVATAVRLDEPDPVAAWKEHIAKLAARATALNERRFDALRYRGPGTDLTVGPAPELELDGRARALGRDRARREHADRGGLHLAGRPAGSMGRSARPTRSSFRERSCAVWRSASKTAAPSTFTQTKARS